MNWARQQLFYPGITLFKHPNDNPASDMVSKGQARFPLLLTIFLLAGITLSQTEGLPPSLAWTSQSTAAIFDGSVRYHQCL